MNEQKIRKLESVSQWIISQYFTQNITWELTSEHWIININSIEISSDLSYIDIYVSSFKDNENLPKSLAIYTNWLQRFLNKQLEIRKLPKVRFRFDQSGKVWSNVCNIINEISRTK